MKKQSFLENDYIKAIDFRYAAPREQCIFFCCFIKIIAVKVSLKDGFAAFFFITAFGGLDK
ncbi:MAG: hypothetical protein IJT36_01530 [Alphaproteobacteria bacterium]|nr:hypothetical protein [Alphaproteobacteria bacterium]